MKKFIYISLGLLVAAASSCVKDSEFLTEQPKTIYTFENSFMKPTQVDASLVKCYSDFYRLHSWGTNVWEELPQFIGGGGGSASTLLAGYGSDVHDEDGSVGHFGSSFSNLSGINPEYPRFLAVWNQLYELAAGANLVINGADLVEWTSESDKAYVVSQAKFFVGWCYLRLAECFGSVPIVREFSTEVKYDYARDPRSDVYAFAVECLEAARDGLPEAQKEDGRLTKSAANHYLAEAYLAWGIEDNDNKAHYNKAIEAADKVIAAHPLMTKRFGVRANPSDTRTWEYQDGAAIVKTPYYRPDGNVFYDLFQMGNYNQSAGNTEAILVLQTPTYEEQSANGGRIFNLGNATGQPYRTIAWASAYAEPGTNDGPFGGNVDRARFVGGAEGCYLGGMTWGLYGSNAYLDDYVWRDDFADDMRNAEINLCHPVVMDQNHSLYGQIVTRDMVTEPARLMRVSAKVKMQDAWGWDPHQGQPFTTEYGRDWYAARSAETYLFKAEAQFRAGDAAAAATTINVIRSRAQAGKMLSASDIDIYTILDERTRELSWEEHRWPQLLRMAKEGTDNEVMHHQILNHAMYIAQIPIYSNGIKWSLFPIPQFIMRAVEREVKWTQNKGWE